MKRFISLILVTMLALAALSGTAYAESVYDRLNAAQTLDEQLAVLDDFATENAAELETGGWDRHYTVDLAPGASGRGDTYGLGNAAVHRRKGLARRHARE